MHPYYEERERKNVEAVEAYGYFVALVIAGAALYGVIRWIF